MHVSLFEWLHQTGKATNGLNNPNRELFGDKVRQE